MILRKKILPKSIGDALCCTLMIFVFIPYVYWFELYVVIPYFHGFECLWYKMMWGLGTFIGFNIVTNLLALILCDTSIRGVVLPTEKKEGFRFCSVCESVAPPRSWHCPTCNICILKRDHHCLFSACCVGLNNYRYFFVLVLYLFIALVVSTIYNSFYIWNVIDFKNISWFHVTFPLAMLVYDYTMQQFILLFYVLLTLSMIFCGALFYMHLSMVYIGQSMHERMTKNFAYNKGLMNNIYGTLGLKWYLVWICPFIQSELTEDGINWGVVEADTEKNR